MAETVFKRIVWATDGSASADRCLPLVEELARDDGVAVTAVHVQEFTVAPHAASEPVDLHETSHLEKIEGQVKRLTEAGAATELKVESVAGRNVAHLIAEAAGEEDADLIVLGTRGHSKIGGILLGSVPDRLLKIAPCPVLVVPAGEA
jgi:nucleotide-binding universal stress UspA family protein